MPKTLSLAEGQEEARQGRVRMLFLAFAGSNPLEGATRHGLLNVDEVHLGRGPNRSWTRTKVEDKKVLQITVPDSWMSSRHARLIVNKTSVRVEDLGSKNGTTLNGQAPGEGGLRDGDQIEVGCTIFRYVEIDKCDVREAVLLDVVPASDEQVGLVTLLPSFRKQVGQLKKIANSMASVIVNGESGTGKELIAQAIHNLSRRSGHFVAVNCAAITETLLESELFGHRKGAFSGATHDRKGLIETSSGGTLFLDEIGELSPRGQAALLRVLEQREVMPVGANRPIPVDLRIVCATHRTLLNEVESGAFREDLYARLSAFIVKVPALRERKAELGSIIAALLARNPSDLRELRFTPAAGRALLQYDWPRNVRELEKCLTSAVVLADERLVDVEHLSELVRSSLKMSNNDADDDDSRLRAQLTELLRTHKGNITRVSEAMGKKRQQIQKWCKRLGIDPKLFR
jgi:transcriptional regulator with PAS, ATPase and Fis domain